MATINDKGAEYDIERMWLTFYVMAVWVIAVSDAVYVVIAVWRQSKDGRDFFYSKNRFQNLLFS